MRIADKLRQLNDDVFLGNKSLENAMIELSPDNPDGVWAETIPVLEQIVNSNDFYNLDKEDQDDISEMITSILAFNPKSLKAGKAENSFLAEILEASGWGDAQNVAQLYNSVINHNDAFVPVFDYSKDGRTAELRAEPRINFDESRLANSQYTKLKVTGFNSGVAEDMYVKMKKDEDDLGNVTYSAVLPSGLVEVKDGDLMFNGKSVENGLIKTNEASYKEANYYRSKLESFIPKDLQPKYSNWVNDKIKNRNVDDSRASLGEALRELSTHPDYKEFKAQGQMMSTPPPSPAPYSSPDSSVAGPLPPVNPPPSPAAPPSPRTTVAQRAPGGVGPDKLQEAISTATQGFQKFRQYFKSQQ